MLLNVIKDSPEDFYFKLLTGYVDRFCQDKLEINRFTPSQARLMGLSSFPVLLWGDRVFYSLHEITTNIVGKAGLEHILLGTDFGSQTRSLRYFEMFYGENTMQQE